MPVLRDRRLMAQSVVAELISASTAWSKDHERIGIFWVKLQVKMSVGPAGVADLFYLLESNKLGEVEETKKVFHDHFLCSE